MKRFYEVAARIVSSGDHIARLLSIHSERLLAQYMLARLHRCYRPMLVHAWWQGIVDSIDIGSVNQLCVARHGLRYLVLVRKKRSLSQRC